MGERETPARALDTLEGRTSLRAQRPPPMDTTSYSTARRTVLDQADWPGLVPGDGPWGETSRSGSDQ